MGGNPSKTPQIEPSNNNLNGEVIESDQNNIKNFSNSDRPVYSHLNVSDQQHIAYIIQDLCKNPEFFVLNNMIMAVMFFDDYEKCKETLLKNKLKNEGDFITPDSIFEIVNENVVFRPHHGPKKHESEPLMPKRIFIANETVNVLGSHEEAVENNKGDITVVRIEESSRKGYVKLKELKKTIFQDSGSPVLPLDSEELHSRTSTVSSETTYVAIKNLKTPKPIDISNAIEKQALESPGFPRACMSYRKIEKQWDPDEFQGENITEDDLFDIVSYINSKKFMAYINDNSVLYKVASKLGVHLKEIIDAKEIEEKIYCSITIDKKQIPCQIMPCIKAKWPLEQTLKFLNKSERNAEARQRYVFPTSYMIEEIKTTLDCVLLPKGYLDTTGKRNDVDISWELCFPQAQKYLEACMSFSQIKGLMLLITLHKSFIEPESKNLGLTPEHIRNFFLLECESNCSDWPEYRLGSKLLYVIKKLNDHYLSKAQPHIPDFFVAEKNILNDVPTREIRKSLKVLNDIRQSPLMYFMIALRNIQYTNGETFYPPFNFKALYDILMKSELDYVIRQPFNKIQNKTKIIEPDHAILQLRDSKKRLRILNERKKKQEEEEKEKGKALGKRRGSIDSIDVDWECEKEFVLQKRRELLVFFIKTFLAIAKKGLELSKNVAEFYLKQSSYLAIILQQQSASFTDEVNEFLQTINELENQCANNYPPKQQKNAKKRFNKGVQAPHVVTIKNNTVNNETKTRKSVTFVENHKR